MTKPEYPFNEKAQEDGNNTLNVVFQKWEKSVSLLIGKCPEYIVDALTGIRLHDTITVTKPVRREQLQVTAAIEIQSVECEITPVLSDCFTNVNLKMLLANKYVDSACCTNSAITDDVDCYDCDYTYAFNTNDFTHNSPFFINFAFAYNDGVHINGIYIYDWLFSGTWILYTPTIGTIVCMADGSFYYVGSGWLPLSAIESATYASGVFNLTGYGAGTFIQVEYSLDAGANWIASVADTFDNFTLTGINIPLIYQAGILFRVRSYSRNCDYGYSQVFDYDNP